MSPTATTLGPWDSKGPSKTAVDAASSSSSAIGLVIASALGAAVLLLLVCCYVVRRRGRKRVDDRPITLRRPTAVRNPTSHSHYLKKSPSPTGCKSPPGGAEKSPNGVTSPGAHVDGKNSSFMGLRNATPKLLSPTEEKRQDLGSVPGKSLSPQQEKTFMGTRVQVENESAKPVSPTSSEAELNNRNIKRNDSLERLGQLYFKLRYKSDNGALIVTIVKCTDLPQSEGSHSTSDPYVKLQLLPDKHHKAKTRVLRNTLQPVYDEEFTFYGISASHLKDLTLHFVVLSFDRYSRDDIIGEVVTPLASIDLREPLTLYRPINPRSMKGRGELLLSLCYQPAATRLTVVVLKARNLPKMDITGLSDPYVKIYLLYNGQRVAKKKTHVKKRTVNPVFNESFVFDLPSGAEDLSNVSLDFLLLDWDRVTKNEVIGRLELGGPRCVGSAKHHWAEVITSPRRQIAEWHKLREAPK
ncbi:synaptotagmin-11 isoform X2 [Hyalella azteca]|uniref:Synaptotagmin-11 isoform X2 n=1 Tax=Hyalella azteca TaxID=294128 RepID=A0A8B7PPX4_HYAAZ|nr:synaptotagmin-11 isoform X2 [Hyalella azteca]